LLKNNNHGFVYTCVKYKKRQACLTAAGLPHQFVFVLEYNKASYPANFVEYLACRKYGKYGSIGTFFPTYMKPAVFICAGKEYG
jgi:hypothetical protein